MTTRWNVTFDCANPARLAQFWSAALGYAEPSPPTGFANWEAWLAHHNVPEEEWNDGAYLEDPEGAGPALSFLKVPEPKIAKNRLHFDLQFGGGRGETPWEVRWPRVQAAAETLTAAGATVVDEHDLDGRPDHVVMADPEGNEFCVV